jgi:exopolyphosphatase/guanosine-5'-triphosphate,3'-diphosphate pyrophosphatase
MSTAGIVLSRPSGTGGGNRRTSSPRDVRVARAAAEGGVDELVVVLGDEARAGEFPQSATLLLDDDHPGSTDALGSRALRSAIDWCARQGHDAVVVALSDDGAALEPEMWSALARSTAGPIVVLEGPGPVALARIGVEAWPAIPLDGAASGLLTARPELVVAVDPLPRPATPGAVPDGPGSDGPGSDGPRTDAPQPTLEERAAVERLLGRPPQGAFTIAVRSALGEPVVIENAPFLDDGTPMPTRYWLVGRIEQEAVGRLEAAGGVRRAAAAVPAAEIASAHARYGAARDARIPRGYSGPRPHGGVGGTREGVKCLHAHLAWYLAGGADPVGRWTAAQLVGQIDGPVGAVDCGTNSTRLLVLGRDGTVLAREMTITRLGEGVDRTGELLPEAIGRTLTVLRRYREILDASGAVACRAAATSAARDAKNAAAFFDGAEAALGVRPELLSGEEEGRLSYAGATGGDDSGGGPYLVCDLGGGSTELVAGGTTGSGPAATVSMNVGCVRITERFLAGDPPTPTELAAARGFVTDAVEGAIAAHPELALPRAMIGIAGTVSALCALALGLDAYDHDALDHARLTRSAVDGYLEEFSTMPVVERRRRHGLEPARADVIVGGALVLSVVMERFGHEALTYSASDILDGLAGDLRSRIRARIPPAPIPSPFGADLAGRSAPR